MKKITAEPLSAENFAPFGDVLEAAGPPDRMINAGMCGRFHDRATLDFGADVAGKTGNGGRAGISIFDATPRALPYIVDLLERHPDGSQAFIPMHTNDWLVIVAHDRGGAPGTPLAFIAGGHQGINFHRGTWHGVLTPLHAPGLFAVIDRIGDTPNLEEFRLDPQFVVQAHP